MSQHDLTIANQGFPAFRADLNSALQALGSCQSGTSAPSPTFANQLWYDSTNNILKIRNEDNDAWISIATLDQTNDVLSVIALNIISEGTSGSGVTIDGVLLKDNAVTASADASISGLTVGKGGGTATNSTAVGLQALNNASSTGTENSAFGRQALYSLTSGGSDVAVGNYALYSNTTGNYNTALGYSALQNNTTASLNTASGYQSMYTNTTGQYNTAYGANALKTNNADANTAVGSSAMFSNTTGANNVAVGITSLYTNTTGSSNTALGYYALAFNTTADRNTAVGYQAFYSNTTGTYNTAIGWKAGYSNTTSADCTFIGEEAGYSTNGAQNTFVGGSAGYSVTSGTKNTILGRYTGNGGGLDIRTASNYIVLSDGDGNPRLNIDGSGNITVGANASQLGKFSADIGTVRFTDGTPSAFLNWRSNQATGRPCIQVQNINSGNDAAFRTAAWDGTNSLYWTFGQNINSTATNFDFCYNSVAGAQTSGSGTCYVRFTNSGQIYNTSGTYGTISDIKLKENIVDASPKLNDLMKLKVRNFTLKADETKAKQLGFIAQEMQEVFPACVETFDDFDPDTKEKTGETLTVKTAVLIPMLVKAIQELKAEVDSLKQQLGK